MGSGQSTTAPTQRTLVLAVLRDALLDLLPTDDLARTIAAVHQRLMALRQSAADTATAPRLEVSQEDRLAAFCRCG